MPCRWTTSSTAALSRRSTFSKTYLGWRLTLVQVAEVTGVGEAIEVDQPLDLRPVDDVMDEIGADEAGAAGDEEVHAIFASNPIKPIP